MSIQTIVPEYSTFFPFDFFPNKLYLFTVMKLICPQKFQKHMKYYVNRNIFLFWRASKSVIFILFLFLFIFKKLFRVYGRNGFVAIQLCFFPFAYNGDLFWKKMYRYWGFVPIQFDMQSLLAILRFTYQKLNHWSAPPQNLPYLN